MPSVTQVPPREPDSALLNGSPARRRRRQLLFAVAFTVALVASGAGLFVARYQPLCSPATCAGAGGAWGSTVHQTGDSAARVVFRSGAEFSLGFTLSSQGPLGVTVTEIGRQLSGPSMRVVAVRIASSTVRTFPPRGRPFHPFSLTRADPTDVVVTLRLEGCMASGTSILLGSMPMSYRVLGIAHHAWVPLPVSLTVVAARGATCSP